MSPVPYKIHSITKQLTNGSTRPYAGAVNAIIKFDVPESPYCVYNELVAVRLAQTFHIQVADGVLTFAKQKNGFASLEIDAPGIELPDVGIFEYVEVADAYPGEVAALTVFDVLIGNNDRSDNIMRCLAGTRKVFRAYDHSHALLCVEKDADASIRALHSNALLAEYTPFYNLIDAKLLAKWADRFANTADELVAECCHFNRDFDAVTIEFQERLAKALVWRKNNLPQLISGNLSRYVSTSKSHTKL